MLCHTIYFISFTKLQESRGQLFWRVFTVHDWLTLRAKKLKFFRLKILTVLLFQACIGHLFEKDKNIKILLLATFVKVEIWLTVTFISYSGIAGPFKSIDKTLLFTKASLLLLAMKY